MTNPSSQRHLPPGLLLAALLLTVVAALGTRLPLERDYFRYLLVFDVTQSMNVSDPAPGTARHTRLEWSKLAAQELLARLPCGSAIGVGLFTQHRSLMLFTPVEVCAHYDEIGAMITDIDWRTAWRARSEIAKGIHSALAITGDLNPPTRLVFFTDGHEAPPVHPDFPPRFTGELGAVQGLIVGMGGELPLPIPKLDAAGERMGVWAREEVMQVDVYSRGRSGDVAGESMVGVDAIDVARRIATGTEHLSSLREAYLLRLAARVGLDYQRLTNTSALTETLTSPRYAFRRAAVQDIHRWLGALALFCILLIYMIYLGGGRRRRQHGDAVGVRRRAVTELGLNPDAGRST